jgi:hypothetical protein
VTNLTIPPIPPVGTAPTFFNITLTEATIIPSVMVTIRNNTNGNVIPNALFSFIYGNGSVTNYTTEANGSYIISNLTKGAKYQVNTSINGFKPSYSDVFGDNLFNPVSINLDEKLEEVSLTFKVVRPPPNTECSS